MTNLANSTLRMLFLVFAYLVCESTSLVISTAQGRLRGIQREGRVSYLGIPYATISSSSSRFKGAGLAPTWSGVREPDHRHCTSYSPVEDCLHLDVHTPSTAGSPWPVMVWVRGSSGQYNPERLVKQGIVVVVVSHRMGPAGFLCLRNEKIPGNAGVKDVVLALRWVRDNIVAFKGNPHKVVIAGQGFGAAMVEAIILSSSGDGLYHGAILQSGSVLSPWAFNYDAIARAKSLAKLLSDDDGNNPTAVLLNASIEELASKSDKLDVSYFPFGLCAEKYFKDEEILIIEPPNELIKRRGRSVPIIVGYNSDEAYVFTGILQQSKVVNRIPGDMSFILPEELKFMNEGEVRQAIRQIQDAYFKDNITFYALLEFHRDAYYVNHIYRSVRRHSSTHSPVYFYQFSHIGDVGVTPEPGVDKTGAAHSDELAYMFPDEERELEGRDRIVQEKLIRLWTNFVKYLSPQGAAWQQVEPSSPRLLDISHEMKMMGFPHTRATRVWDDIYDKFYYNRHRDEDN